MLLIFLLHISLCLSLDFGSHTLLLLLLGPELGLMGSLDSGSFHSFVSFGLDCFFFFSKDFIDDVSVAVWGVGGVTLLIKDRLVPKKIIPIVRLNMILLIQLVSLCLAYISKQSHYG